VPDGCIISEETTSEFGIVSKFRSASLDVVEDVGGRLDGDFGPETILDVSCRDESVSNVDEDVIRVLYVFGETSNIKGAFIMGWLLFGCDNMFSSSIWFEQ
jgi:hypothetical protein